MKIKKQIDFANPTAKTYCQLVSLIQEYGKINELNVKLTNLKTTNQALKAEINMLNDKLSTIQNKYNSNETKVATLSNELNIKAKELNDITKLHKNEIKTLMEEVKRGEFVEATETEKIQELYTFVKTLEIHTLLDATNVSNMMPVYGYLPEEKDKILAMLKQGADEQGEELLRMRRDSMRSL
jgi:chromosome segregation ATPase